VCLQVKCNIEKVHEMAYKLDVKSMATYLDNAVENDVAAQNMLVKIGRPVLSGSAPWM